MHSSIDSDDSDDDVRASAAASAAANEAADPIEAALADALAKATTASEWSVVSQLAKELEARRLARTADNVVLLRKRGA